MIDNKIIMTMPNAQYAILVGELCLRANYNLARQIEELLLEDKATSPTDHLKRKKLLDKASELSKAMRAYRAYCDAVIVAVPNLDEQLRLNG